jgi:hypothetical protein
VQEIARLAAEEAAKRAAEQLGRLKTAKAAADEAAAAVPPEEESPGRNERTKSPKGSKKKGKK